MSENAADGAPPRPLDYLVLVLVCATAALAGAFEVLLVPLYVAGKIFPITVVLGGVTTWALPRLGSWLTRKVSGAVWPFVAWFVVVLALGFYPRPEGDVLIQGGNSEQWVMFVMVIVAAVVGFATVTRTSLAPPVASR